MTAGDPRRASQRARQLFESRLDRRTLLGAAGALGIAGQFAAFARPIGAAAQAGGEPLATSRPREVVMREILAQYPLRREGAPEGGSVIFAVASDLVGVNPHLSISASAVLLLGLVYEGLVGDRKS